jgi:uncharacterized membrane-anchored protein
MKRQRIALVAIVCMQAIFLVGWAGYHEWLRRTAPVITLKVLPVDPRDIVRGQYFTLGYEIARVPVPADFKREAGAAVWIGLREEGGFAHAIAAFDNREDASAMFAIVARATVVHSLSSTDLRVRYGIEEYYVPEGTPTPRIADLVVKATVSPEGKLNLKQVLLDGRPFP